MADVNIRAVNSEVIEVRGDVMLCQKALGFAQIVTVFQALIVSLGEGRHVDGAILDKCVEDPWLASKGDTMIGIPRNAVAMGSLFMDGFKAAFEDLLRYIDALTKMFDEKGHPYEKDVVGVLNAAIYYLKKVQEDEADGCERKLEEVGH